VNDVVKQGQRRVKIMGAVVAVAAVVAVPSAVGAFAYGHHWLIAPFGAALVAGFGAQIWFIASLRSKKGV
jgi:hypothetical protein